jgi:hypothetical protein
MENRRTFAVEELRAVFASKSNSFGYVAHKFYNLCDMVVVFAITRPRSGVEQIIASGNQFEDLQNGMFMMDNKP